MKKIKHSKFKNTGLICELLTRQITMDVMQNQKSAALSIFKKYFAKNSILSEELQLYNLILKGGDDLAKKTENQINYYIDEVLGNRSKLNERILKKSKYSLINEIKKRFDIDQFFKMPIDSYKVLASTYKLFEGTVKQEINESISYSPIDMVQSRYNIIEFIMNDNVKKSSLINKMKNDNKILEKYKKQDKDIQLLTYKLLIEKFNSKYGDMNYAQKSLLKIYINNFSNVDVLREYVNKEVTRINKKIKGIVSSSKIDDEVTKIKLSELNRQLSSLKKGRVVKDKQFTALLYLYELVDKLENIK